MGVACAGWATLLSQLVSGLLCLRYMAAHYPILHLKREDLHLDKRYVVQLLVMGLPMGMQYSITAIGSILLQSAVNSLGAAAMAAMTAGGKVNLFACCPFDALGSTAATYAGQNIGAGKPERVHKGVQDASVIGIDYAVLAAVLLCAFGGNFTMLFLDAKDQAVIAEILPLATRCLICNAVFYIPLLFVNVLRFTIQGLGFSELAVVAGVFEMIARGVFGLCLVPWLGFDAVCFASPAAWIMADAFLFPAYWHCLKKKGYTPERRMAFRLVKHQA